MFYLVKSTPWHIQYHLQVWIYFKVLFTNLFQKLKTNGKGKICKYWICDHEKSMYTLKRTQFRPLQDVIGSLSPFISTKILVVIYRTLGLYVWTKVVILRIYVCNIE